MEICDKEGRMKKKGRFIDTERGSYVIAITALVLLILLPFYQLISSHVVINAMDTLTQDFFWKAYYREQLVTNPAYMTWNPYLNGGASFNGGLQWIFQPVSLLCNLLFPANFAITAVGLIHLIFAGVGTLLYARIIGLNFISSLLAAVFFMLSTQIVSLFNAGHINKLSTISYLPLVLFLLERAFRNRKIVDFLFLAIVLSLQLYETHIQISFYTCIVVAIYFIWRSVHVYKEEKDPKMLRALYVKATVMVFFFLALSSATFAQWLDFKELSERSSGTSYAFATSWSMPKKELLTYIVPEFFGTNIRNYKDPGKIDVFYWGDMPMTQTNDYLGILPIVLALIALLRFRNRYVNIFAAMALLFQLLALGRHTPFFYPFYEYFGFKFFRVPKMNLFIVAFAVSIIAGHGAQWLLGEIKKKDGLFLKKFLIGFGGFIAAFILFAAYGQISQESLMKHFLSLLNGGGNAYSPSLAAIRYENALNGMWMASATMLVALALLSLRLLTKIKMEIYFAILLLFFVADISILNYKFINAVSMKDNPYFSRDTAIEYFEGDKEKYRVLNAVRSRSEDMIAYQNPNKYMYYKIESLTGYEAVNVARYADILGILNLDNRLLDFLNVKYVVMDKGAVRGRKGDMFGKYEIAVDRDVKILKSSSVLPRAFPVHKARIIKDDKTRLNIMRGNLFSPGDTVLLEDVVEGKLSANPLSEAKSKVEMIHDSPKKYRLNASMADNGFIVMSEKYYLGWKAQLDGKSAKIYKANHAFRAVYVPMGKHEVTMVYDPVLIGHGLKVTILSFLIVAILMVVNVVKLKRKK